MQGIKFADKINSVQIGGSYMINSRSEGSEHNLLAPESAMPKVGQMASST